MPNPEQPLEQGMDEMLKNVERLVIHLILDSRSHFCVRDKIGKPDAISCVRRAINHVRNTHGIYAEKNPEERRFTFNDLRFYSIRGDGDPQRKKMANGLIRSLTQLGVPDPFSFKDILEKAPKAVLLRQTNVGRKSLQFLNEFLSASGFTL